MRVYFETVFAMERETTARLDMDCTYSHNAIGDSSKPSHLGLQMIVSSEQREDEEQKALGKVASGEQLGIQWAAEITVLSGSPA